MSDYYKVIQADELPELEKIVSSYIQRGWSLGGELVINTPNIDSSYYIPMYSQAVIKD